MKSVVWSDKSGYKIGLLIELKYCYVAYYENISELAQHCFNTTNSQFVSQCHKTCV